MERLEKFTNRCLDREKAQENPLNSDVSNVQIINQEEKVDTSLPNDQKKRTKTKTLVEIYKDIEKRKKSN
jgi:hypothetical protein